MQAMIDGGPAHAAGAGFSSGELGDHCLRVLGGSTEQIEKQGRIERKKEKEESEREGKRDKDKEREEEEKKEE